LDVTFFIETRPSDSPFVDRVWRARSERAGSFVSIASVGWEMVVTRRPDTTFFTIRGPQTLATELTFASGVEWFGVTFKVGTLMPSFPPARLADGRDANLPAATTGTFWLHGSAWQLPTFDNVDEFLRRLVHEGLLIRDAVVQSAYRDNVRERSVRSIQYHFVQSTGLTQSMVRQIERARAASELLRAGIPVLDAVHEFAYFDQAHMSRALKRFIGRTPAQLARGE
jgi:acetyl esterase/lipase